MNRLRPGEEPHACRDCDRCQCGDDPCPYPCDWDCGCPAYLTPEEDDL